MSTHRNELETLLEAGPPPRDFGSPHDSFGFEHYNRENERTHREWCARVTGLAALLQSMTSCQHELEPFYPGNPWLATAIGIRCRKCGSTGPFFDGLDSAEAPIVTDSRPYLRDVASAIALADGRDYRFIDAGERGRYRAFAEEALSAARVEWQ